MCSDELLALGITGRFKETAYVAEYLKKQKPLHQRMLGILMENFMTDYPHVLFVDVGDLKKFHKAYPESKNLGSYRPDAILANEQEEKIWLEVEEDSEDIFKKIVKIGYLLKYLPNEIKLPSKVIFFTELIRYTEGHGKGFLEVCKELWEFFKIKSELQIFIFDYYYTNEQEGFIKQTQKIKRIFPHFRNDSAFKIKSCESKTNIVQPRDVYYQK